MHIRGVIIAKLGWKFEYVSSLSSLQLQYVYYWLSKVDTDWFNRLEDALGTRWNSDKIKGLLGGGSKSTQDEFRVPLSLVIRPELRDTLKKEIDATIGYSGAEYKPGEEEKVEDLSTWSVEEFKDLIERRGIPKGR